MNSKGYLDISFSWIFAIVVGAMILFGAVYGLNKFTDTSRTRAALETGTELSNLLSSLKTDVEEGKIVPIYFPLETRIENDCKLTNSFGRQGFSINEKINDKWGDSRNLGIYSENRYVFSESRLEGKTFYSFSKPLDLPFKVADLIYLFPEEDKYCFSGGFSNEIEKDLGLFNHPNLLTKDCDQRKDVIEVCFSSFSSSCDIKVNYAGGYVKKNEETIYFLGDALMYAAIFSDKEIYECGVKRILYRAQTLAQIYHEKGLDLSTKGCESPIVSDLSLFKTKLSQISNSEDLPRLESDIERIGLSNKYTECRLW